jgi:outer membrane protein TolC
MVADQYVSDVAVKEEFLAVKALSARAHLQKSQADHRLQKSGSDLAKAMGLDELPGRLPPDPPAKKIPEADTTTCVALAFANRPDLHAMNDMEEMSRQGKKAALAGRLPRVDFQGFYGKSGSAYAGDPLIMKEDWQLGVEVVQSFFGQTAQVNGNALNTSPRLGESSRTNSETVGGRIEFFSTLRQATERKEADLALRDVLFRKNELKRDIASDVLMAVAGLKETSFAVTVAEDDLAAAEENFRVVESKGRYARAGLLERSESRHRLAAARAARLASLADYQIAIAALNHSIGVPYEYVMD